MNTLHKAFLPPIGDLLAFEAVARHASISRAADELHLTQSAVSRQIRQLESQLGLSLFHRVRQRVVLTDVGHVYVTDVRSVLREFSGATQKARAMAMSGADGQLNLAVLPTFGTRWLIPRLGAFTSVRPNVTINFSARTEPIDFTQEPFDAAIHFGTPHWPGARCDFLMHEKTVAVCSPHYQRVHAIASPADLARVVLLQQSTRPGQWAQWFAQAGLADVPASRGPSFEQFSMMSQAAVSSLGAALLPTFLIESEIARGDLVVLFEPLLSSGASAYHLVYPQVRADAPLLRAFRDWIVAEASSATAPSSSEVGGD